LAPWLHEVDGAPAVVLRGKAVPMGVRADVQPVRALAQA
jgi:hypothetical protein